MLGASLRSRLLVLVLCAVGPAAALLLYSDMEQRRQAAAAALDAALNTARLASSEHAEQIKEARHLLGIVARLPAVQRPDADACNRLLASILEQSTSYTGLIAARPSGDVFCSAVPFRGPVNLGQRAAFRRAVETRRLAVGGYELGRISGKPTLPIVSPVVDASGALRAVVGLGIDLRWLSRLAAEARLPEGSVLTVVDRNGVILARSRDAGHWTGKSAPEAQIVRTVLARQEGVVDTIGIDGVRRFYGFLPLARDEEGTPMVYVWAGIPKSVALAPADRARARNLILVGVAVLAAFATTWWFGNRSIASPIRALVTATTRVARGDLDARVGMPQERGELAQLGRAFDEMTAVLRNQEAERRRAEELAAAVARVGRELSGTLDPARAADLVASTLLTLLRSQNSALYRLDRESGALICLSAAGGSDPEKWRGRRLAPGHAVVGRAVADGATIWSADFLADPRITVPDWLGERATEEGYRSVLAAPLKVRGEVIGALSVGDVAGRTFSEEERRLLSTFADQAALALKNAQLFEETERRRRAAESLAGVERLISQSLDFGEVGQRIADSVRTLLGGNSATLYRLALESGDLVRVAFSGDQGPTLGRDLVLSQGTGVAGLAVSQRGPVATPNLLTDARVTLTPEARARIERAAFRAVLAVPLVARDRVIGVLTAGDQAGRVFDGEDIRVMEAFADQAAVALENARLYDDVKRTRDFLQSIAENSPDAIVTTDAEGRVTYVSPGGEEMFGYRADEMIGGTIAEYYRSGLDEARAIMHRLRAEGRITDYETAVRVGAGGWATVNVSISLLRDANGEITGTLGIFRDVTERKQAEESLRASEAKFRGLVDAAPDAIVIIDGDDRILLVNAQAEKMFGYMKDVLLGQRVEVLLPERFQSAHAQHRLSYFSAPRTRAMGGGLALAGRRKDGSEFPVEVSLSPLGTGDGIAVIAVIRDITERQQLEAQIRQLQKIEAVGQLAGGVAHDFNNLLTVITGRTQMMMRHLGPADPLRRHLDLIERTSGRAASLTRQFLAFSRKQVLQPKVLKLNTVVAEMEAMLLRLIGEHIDFRTVLAPALGRVKADPGQIEQVIMNLVVNARDAMPEGGRLTVETANVELDEAYAVRHVDARAGQYVMIRVSDTGIGMDQDTQARIFEPFFTTKERGKGTGLGLSTVYGIVKQSGGIILVYSEPGRGTAFKVYLPRVEEEIEALPPDATVARSPQGSETVLLAEDDEDLRELAREVLQANGYSVLEASRPLDALLVAERHEGPIHLLVTDVVMPQMSGRDLAERLAALRRGIKVLYISGYTDDAIMHHGVLDPGVVLLEKPFTADALARKVREVLDGPA